MHHIYHTEGIILGSKNRGEDSRYFYIFTKELGMVYASVSGVRKMSSKLRFILQDYSYLKIDLVQGKNFFRVTSASKTNKLDSLIKDKEKFKVFYNVCRLLRRLLAGIEPNQDLFVDFLENLKILEKVKNSKEIEGIEILMVLRILNNLGYIGSHKEIENIIKSPFEHDMVMDVSKSRKLILQQINKALKETHL